MAALQTIWLAWNRFYGIQRELHSFLFASNVAAI